MSTAQTYISMTWEEFEEKYKPIQNHITKREEFNGWLFESYDADLEYIQGLEVNHLFMGDNNIWTIMSSDEYKVMIGNGYRHVNRMGYVITEVPWNDGESIDVLDEDDKEENEDIETSNI